MKSYIPILSIAGSDSGGGAGIQADLKTFSALGCYGMTVITSVTAQNTQGVKGIYPLPVDFVEKQLKAVLADIPPAAIKIGMLDRPELVMMLKEVLKDLDCPIVLDPVMVAASGDPLIQEDCIAVLKEFLFPLVDIITPNLDEASILLDRSLNSLDALDSLTKEEVLNTLACPAVLIKGGHLSDQEKLRDYLFSATEQRYYESPRIPTHNSHGTGCTLSSAMACFLAQGFPLSESIAAARDYIWQAIEAGKDVKTGQGSGPLNHFFNPIKQKIR